MRCLGCKYNLRGLAPAADGEHRCPECGREFDPNEPSEFEERKRLPRRLGILLAILAVALILFLAAPALRRLGPSAPRTLHPTPSSEALATP